ncbi:hypothetical protein [Burkholderia anthina]|uniref:hypothetical protein n=1 Tax=Burkholderia anthina TaxID=179879 RepID=UPI00158E77D5|nr:hypothetical protein [Burkholderia anthina]
MFEKLGELVTGDDNKTIEPAYFLGALAFLIGLGLEVYAVTEGKPFDLQSYGLGVGALLVAVGAGKKLGN